MRFEEESEQRRKLEQVLVPSSFRSHVDWILDSKYTFCTRYLIRIVPLDRFPNRQCQSLERRLGPAPRLDQIVFPVQVGYKTHL